MAGLNKVMLIGRIGKDPDTFTFENGNKKISFTLATTESYRDKEGNWVDQTEWHNIAGYRYLADKNVAKGDLVYVEGKIKTRKYQDKEGNDRYVTEIVADKINIIIRRNSDGNNFQNNPVTESGSVSDIGGTGMDSKETDSNTTLEDDLPF
jgi:single-strand DNA-binding protein